MDAMSMNTYLQTQYNNQTKALAESTAKSISGISETSSKEEIEDAVKYDGAGNQGSEGYLCKRGRKG